ncbi:MAG: hypothetical protein ACREPT_13320 [Rudaea sp.]
MAIKKGKKDKKGASLLHHMQKITPAIHAAVSAAVKTSSPKGGVGAARVGGPGPVVNPKFVTVTVGFEVDDSDS